MISFVDQRGERLLADPSKLPQDKQDDYKTMLLQLRKLRKCNICGLLFRLCDTLTSIPSTKHQNRDHVDYETEPFSDWCKIEMDAAVAKCIIDQNFFGPDFCKDRVRWVKQQPSDRLPSSCVFIRTVEEQHQ